MVEGAQSSRKMPIRLLEKDCRFCVGASNGRDAVEMIEYEMDQTRLKTTSLRDGEDSSALLEEFDILIEINYKMPIMNGPDAVRAIRGHGYTGYRSHRQDYLLRCGRGAHKTNPAWES